MGTIFEDKETCENIVEGAISTALTNSFRSANNRSIQTHDTSGNHGCRR